MVNYEEFKNQCPVCKEYLAMEIIKETKNFYYWKCRFCGFKRRHKRRWCIIKQSGDRTLMKRNGWKKFKEVELEITKKYIRVRPKLKTLFDN